MRDSPELRISFWAVLWPLFRRSDPGERADTVAMTASAAPEGNHVWRRWPLPALLFWGLAWLVFLASQHELRATPAAAFAMALAVGGAGAWAVDRPLRRIVVVAGFPVSALTSGGMAGLPAWLWLLPLALLLVIYPLRAWRDAPLFPTPPRALDGLATRIDLPVGAKVLDAGCGLGDGLRALRSAWPQAEVQGIEWSWPLTLAAAVRCRFATVRRADMWASAWSGQDLVYLFQRPESMARAWDKALAEMRPGAWLVSLEFAVPGRRPDVELALAGNRRLQAWRIPAQSGVSHADNLR